MCTGWNPLECFTLLFKSLIPKVLDIELGKQRPVKVNMGIHFGFLYLNTDIQEKLASV